MYNTGYYARASAEYGRARSTKHHIVEKGKPICGFRPHPTMAFQYNCAGIRIEWIDCKKCKNLGEKIIADAEMKIQIERNKNKTNQDANIRLILASKDLLKACKKVSPLLDGLINRTPSGKKRNELCDINILVKTAINKATNSPPTS